LNGGLYPDLHRPIPIQRLLHSPAGALLAPLATERAFRSTMGQITGRPLPDPVLHDMWRAVSHDGGRRVQHRLLRYIDDRREHAERWTSALEGYRGPARFIWGPADPISGGHVLPRRAERLPDPDIVVLDGVGHYPQLEAAGDVAAALATFLGTSGS
jgi:pimeloyl-ACP methyl ester carboxylesterase